MTNVLQIKFEDGCYRPFFLEELCPLRYFTVSGLFFSFCLQIFIWYLVHCFAIPRYRSSLSLVLIHWFFRKLWPLDLEKNHELSVLHFFFSYSFDIWYIALPYLDTDQLWVWFWSIDFSRSYGPWTKKKITNYQFSALFSLCLQIFIWCLVHCFAIPRYRLSFSLALIHWFFTKLWPLDLEKKITNY
jgi:hypothetical protein